MSRNPERGHYFEEIENVYVMRALGYLGLARETEIKQTNEELTCGSTAVNKYVALFLGIKEAKVPWNLHRPENSSDLMKTAVKISKEEPGPVKPKEVAKVKLEGMIKAVEKTGGDEDFLTVGDVAIVAKVGSHVMQDVKKPETDAELGPYIQKLFLNGKQEIKSSANGRENEKITTELELDYDAATGWAKKQERNGKLTWRKLLMQQRMIVKFNKAAVEHMSEEKNAKEFAEFFRSKRIQLVKSIKKDHKEVTNEALGQILGPDLYHCAGAIPLEYLIWYLMEKTPSDSGVAVEVILPEMTKIEGLELNDENSMIFRPENIAELPLTNILQYMISHVHNYPSESVKEACEFFQTKNSQGFDKHKEIDIFPNRRRKKRKAAVAEEDYTI